ncbi:cwfJ domain-containing protein [Colletotrichum karsti]|uniref:CwfJ domain-containing protein n=1 Tax=Colletotrichum karsti TaxID=1095194 RepID=A0A9P6IBY4_9PEZI|nr:cwfJ domain-containing protein [Colletotrichum karsti]KAF9879684.1 cwfJ domain-containing protein [Colletotrichum karsti]
MTSHRIVLGSLNGALQPAFSKVATLHAKNSFSFAIVTGNLFGAEDDAAVEALLNGEIEVPLPVYFTVGTTPLPPKIVAKIEADEEIAENLHYLGKRSITKTSEGIRIVALGGKLDKEVVGGQSKEQHLPFHTADDAKSLKGANKADILLTTVWPAGVWTNSKVEISPEKQATTESTAEIAELCATLKPRYHFAPSSAEFFYEREPFFHPTEEGSEDVAVTRFISMAPYGNASKAKALYAFTLQLNETTVERPAGATYTPFSPRKPKRRAQDEGSYNRFANGDDDGRHHRRGNKRRRRSPPPGPDRCFFCLSNPNLDTHMIATVGDDSYLATAKGPLATSETFKKQGLNFPGHVIITPHAHTPTIYHSGVESYSPEDAERTFKEMTRFRDNLQSMVSTKSNHKLGAITWEISRQRNIHAHWQFHPIPADSIYKNIVEAGFKVEAENLKYPEFETRDLSYEDQGSIGDYFRVWIWADNGEDRIKGTCLVMKLDPEMRFDLQYPRKVVAKLLKLEDRFFWQDCVQAPEEETKDVEAFREAFKEWDFTLQG